MLDNTLIPSNRFNLCSFSEMFTLPKHTTIRTRIAKTKNTVIIIGQKNNNSRILFENYQYSDQEAIQSASFY